MADILKLNPPQDLLGPWEKALSGEPLPEDAPQAYKDFWEAINSGDEAAAVAILKKLRTTNPKD